MASRVTNAVLCDVGPSLVTMSRILGCLSCRNSDAVECVMFPVGSTQTTNMHLDRITFDPIFFFRPGAADLLSEEYHRLTFEVGTPVAAAGQLLSVCKQNPR